MARHYRWPALDAPGTRCGAGCGARGYPLRHRGHLRHPVLPHRQSPGLPVTVSFLPPSVCLRAFEGFRYVVLNHYRFAQVIIDRFAVYGGRKFRFEVEGLDQYNLLAEGESGFVQVFSHAGNYELAGYELRQPRKRLYALLFRDGSQTIMDNRASVFAPNGVEMVFVQPDMSHIFLLSNVVRDGNIASIPGDRIFGSRKFVECQFMGSPARFPLGPFRLAAVRQAPIVAIFVMKESWTSYRIFVRRLDSSDQGQKPTALGLAQQFAANLEEVVRRYPEQWFNYFDFWQNENNGI